MFVRDIPSARTSVVVNARDFKGSRLADAISKGAMK
jgi:hypothetical protein